MIRKVRQRNRSNKWEVVLLEVKRYTFIVSADNRWEALDKSEYSMPTIEETLDSVTEVVRRITYS